MTAYTGPRNGRTYVGTLVVARSKNPKLSADGSAAATYRTQGSCPTTCSFYPVQSACYADTFRGFGHAVKHGAVDPTYADVRTLARTLPHGGIVRWNVSGDYLSADGTPDMAYIDATNHVARTRPDVTHIAYTHAWRILRPDMFAYTVNASADSAEEALEARAAGWPVAAAVPQATLDNLTTAGRQTVPLVQCPQTREGSPMTCQTCKLCARPRNAIVGFPVHGTGARRAESAIGDGWTVGPDGRIVRTHAADMTAEPMRDA
jgi:hypothetical protein